MSSERSKPTGGSRGTLEQRLRKLNKLRAAVVNAQAKYEDFLEIFSRDCPHPESHRSEWTHRRSNGFGSWSLERMPHCLICNKVQYNSAYSYRWGPIPLRDYED